MFLLLLLTRCCKVAFPAFYLVVLFLITGLLLDARLWFAGIALFPVMLLGTAIGRRIHVRLSRGHIARVIGGLLVVSGVSLIARSIASH